MADLQAFRNDVVELLYVLRDMEAEAIASGYTGMDLKDIAIMRRNFYDTLPQIEEAAAKNNRAIAAGAFYLTLNYFRGYVVDDTFGKWSKVWKTRGKDLMVHATAISREEARAYEATL